MPPFRVNCAAPGNNFTYTAGQTQFTSTYDAKVDHHFSARDSMFARYTFNKVNVFIPAPLPVTSVAGVTVNPGAGPYGANFAGPAVDEEHSAALGYTHLLTSNLILDLKAQYMRLNNQSSPVNIGKDVATAFGFPGGSSPFAVNLTGDQVSSGLPNISSNIQGYAALGDADYVPLLDQNNTFQYVGFGLMGEGNAQRQDGRRLDSPPGIGGAELSSPRQCVHQQQRRLSARRGQRSCGSAQRHDHASDARLHGRVPDFRSWEPLALCAG